MVVKEMLIKELTRPYGKELINGLGWRKSWVDNNEQIQGWSTKEEHLALYNAARIETEDVLEIGCFLGRSTVHLAAGLKISGRRNMAHILELELNIDKLTAILWGLTEDELLEIQESLIELD